MVLVAPPPPAVPAWAYRSPRSEVAVAFLGAPDETLVEAWTAPDSAGNRRLPKGSTLKVLRRTDHWALVARVPSDSVTDAVEAIAVSFVGPEPPRAVAIARRALLRRPWAAAILGPNPDTSLRFAKEEWPKRPVEPAIAPSGGFGEASVLAAVLGGGKGSLLYRVVRDEYGAAYSPVARVTIGRSGWTVTPVLGPTPAGTPWLDALLAAPIEPADVERARGVVKAGWTLGHPFAPYADPPESAAYRAWFALGSGEPWSPPSEAPTPSDVAAKVAEIVRKFSANSR